MSRTVAQCVVRLRTFHSRLLQNNKVKSPEFARSKSGNRDGKLSFPMEFNAADIHYAEVEVWRTKRK